MMTFTTLLTIKHWLAEWWPTFKAYGIAGFWMAGLIAAAVLVPWLSFRVRVVMVTIAGVIFLCTTSFTVGIKMGADRVWAKWDWALEVEAKNGEALRDDAVVDVRNRPDSVRNESPWNRDNWKKQKDD